MGKVIEKCGIIAASAVFFMIIFWGTVVSVPFRVHALPLELEAEEEYIGYEDIKDEVLPKKNGWYRDEEGNRYYYKQGRKIKNALRRIDGYTYYFRKNGRALCSAWKTLGVQKYYFRKNGRAAVGSYRVGDKYYIFKENGRRFRPSCTKIVEVAKKKYMVKEGGLAAAGWKYSKSRVYYAKKNGECAKNEKISYIPFGRNACAKNTYQACAKMLAGQFIRAHCRENLSKQEKFKICFRHIMACTHYVSGSIQPKVGEKDWYYRAAITMFTTDLTGNCFGIASAVAAVAKELGYQPYEIWAKEDHAFVIVNGKYYDNMHGAVFGRKTHWKYTVQEKVEF